MYNNFFFRCLVNGSIKSILMALFVVAAIEFNSMINHHLSILAFSFLIRNNNTIMFQLVSKHFHEHCHIFRFCFIFQPLIVIREYKIVRVALYMYSVCLIVYVYYCIVHIQYVNGFIKV